MKICIPSTGEDLTSSVDLRFGRCAYFLIVDSETGEKIETVENTGMQDSRGAGISAAQIVTDKKVEAILVGNLGPNAYTVLSQAGIKCYQVSAGQTVKQAVEAFKQGQLQLL